MSKVKKAGLLVGAVIMVLTVIIMIIGNKIMSDEPAKSNKGGNTASQQTQKVVTKAVTQPVQQQTTQTVAQPQETVKDTADKELVEIEQKQVTIVEIDAADLTEGKILQDEAVIKDKKPYYSDGQVYYALILKTTGGKVLKYYVAYNNYIAFDIEDKFDVTIREYLDDKGNSAYCVEDISAK